MPFFLLAGATILGSGISALGASGAAHTQADAANRSADLQKQMYDETVQREQPFVSAGSNALKQLMAGLGIGSPGDATGGVGFGDLTKPFDPSRLAETPGYQFTLQQGLEGLSDARTATGGVGGGNALKDIVKYSEGLAGTTFQQQLQDYLTQQQQRYNMLQTVAGSGQNAAANLGALGADAGRSIGSDIIGAGNASAAGQVGVANAFSSGAGGLANNYLLSQLLKGGGLGGFGGGGGAGLGTIGGQDAGAFIYGGV